MLQLTDIPIRAKLRLLMMLTATVTLLVACGLLFYHETASFRQTLHRDLETLAQIIGDNSTAALDFNDREAAEEILGALRADPQIVAAGLYRRPGGLFADYSPSESQWELPAEPQGPGFQRHAGHLTYLQPIVEPESDEILGQIYLVADFRRMADRSRVYAWVLGLVLIATLTGAYFLSVALERVISKPILDLTRTAKAISENHDYSVRARKQSTDEIGLFVDAFNQMLAQIQSQNAELRQAKRELEQRVAERTQELQQVQRQQERILFSAGEAIYGLDLAGQITFANPAAARITGWSVETLLGSREHEMLHHLDDERFPPSPEACPLCRGLNEGKVCEVPNVFLRRRNGEGFYAVYLRNPIVDQGQLLGAVVVMQDVTERKKAEDALAQRTEELARSNAELEQFAYVASHDLQEPLRMVSNYTQLLGRRYQGQLDTDADDFIAYAVDGARRMQTLINDLLQYSRVGTRGKEFDWVESAEVLAQARTNLTRAIEEQEAVVTQEALPTVWGDAGQLVQLFQNLIGNAIKFRGSDPPRVHITSREDESQWHFSVQDNGIGVDPDFAEKIFAIFQRLHGPQQYPGTGIGLSICKKIVERHNGTIWVEPGPQRGTIFHFTLAKPRQTR